MKDITSISLVVPLRRADAAGTRDVGGKGANLARMVRNRLPVPDGFCIRTAAFDRFLEGVDQLESFYANLEELAFEPSESVQAAAAQIRQHLAEVPIPADIADQIISAWQALGADLAYAVRSSATAEDLPQASCAGQHDTFLNVRGRDALLAAVRRCWISLFTDRAVLYRMRNHIPQRSAAMAVTVQQMVSADAAGVVFTADPLTGDRGRIVMEATWGLGETLVSGKVGPDRIVLDKRTLRVVESSVGRKTIEIVPDMAGGVRQQAVVAERQDQPCLDEIARPTPREVGVPGRASLWLSARSRMGEQRRPYIPAAIASHHGPAHKHPTGAGRLEQRRHGRSPPRRGHSHELVCLEFHLAGPLRPDPQARGSRSPNQPLVGAGGGASLHERHEDRRGPA